MTNRGWSACLALIALVWMPADASACAVAPESEDDECAEYVWGYDENGVRVSGERIGEAADVSESQTIDVGISAGIDAGGSGTRTIDYPAAAYELSNGDIVVLNCVTYEPIEFLDT